MSRLKYGALVVVTVTTSALLLAGAPPVSAESGAANDANEAVATAQQVRVRFGLRSDPGYVAQVARQAKSSDDAPLGVPLTSAERREMARREAVGESLGRVEQAVEHAQPGSFAGTWLDQAAGGVAVVATTSPNRVSVSALQALLPLGAQLRVEQVRNSAAALAAAQEHVMADLPRWRQRGVQVASVGTFPQDNLVRVRLNPGIPPTALAAFRAAYDSDVVRIDLSPAALAPTASRTATTGTLYGGARIVWYPGSGQYEYLCTASTYAKINTENYGTTAGHCGKGPLYTQGSDLGDSLGAGQRNGFYDSTQSTCDCTIYGPIGTKHSSQVIVGGGSLYTYTNYAASTANLYVGRPACISGATTNAVLCDQIRANNVADPLTEQGHNVTIIYMIELWCPDRPGDSGAPVGDGPTWLGINSAGFNQEGTSNACGDDTKGVVDASPVRFLQTVTGAVPGVPAQ